MSIIREKKSKIMEKINDEKTGNWGRYEFSVSNSIIGAYNLKYYHLFVFEDVNRWI